MTRNKPTESTTVTPTPDGGETTYAVRDGETTAEAVVRAVATGTRSDPTELPPLYDAVEPDALNRLFSPAESDARRTTGAAAFSYAGQRVRVESDGTVALVRDASD